MSCRHDRCARIFPCSFTKVASLAMPERKRVQGPEETNCPRLYLREEEQPDKKPPISPGEGTREDGRKTNEIRPMYLNTEINPHALGSAYLEMRHTKVVCTVHGPKEYPRREDFDPQGRLTCKFKFAPFSCQTRRQNQQDQEEKDYSVLFVQALQRVIRLETFPKLQLEINVMVLENGGGALAAAINCASLALLNSGVEMLDVPTACSVVQVGSEFIVDPALNEEYNTVLKSPGPSAISGEIMTVYLPSLDEVTALTQKGAIKHEDVFKGVELCVEGCIQVHQRMREFLNSKSN